MSKKGVPITMSLYSGTLGVITVIVDWDRPEVEKDASVRLVLSSKVLGEVVECIKVLLKEKARSILQDIP